MTARTAPDTSHSAIRKPALTQNTLREPSAFSIASLITANAFAAGPRVVALVVATPSEYPNRGRLLSVGVNAEELAHQRWTLRVVCVSTALLLLNVAAPQVALEEIGSSLRASFSELQWVLSGYALALAVLLLTAGSLADRFGRP